MIQKIFQIITEMRLLRLVLDHQSFYHDAEKKDSFRKRALIYKMILLEFLRNKQWGEYIWLMTMMTKTKIVIICSIFIIAQWSLCLWKMLSNIPNN